MRRAKLEGGHIGRRLIDIDRVRALGDRNRWDTLTELAKAHRVSRATISQLLKQAKDAAALPL
jgi:hypothetical protein